MIRIFAACSPGEVRVAVAEGDCLIDYAVWRRGAPDGVGDILRGRITAIVPAMGGAFVGLPEAEGFLPDSDGAAGLSAGSLQGVRITRAAQGGKGPRLSARNVSVPAGGDVALIARGPGPIERFATLFPHAPIVADEAALVAELRPVLGDRISVQRENLDEALATQIASLAEFCADLPGGARMSVWPTPALVAIDVDSGRATDAGGRKAAAQLTLNRAAIPAIASQIRLRNLSGAILLDLAGMKAKRRIALGPALAEALAADPLRPRFLGFTALGLAEISRPRIHPPLHEILDGPHAAGLNALRKMAAEPNRNQILRVAPPIAAALARDPLAMQAFLRMTGKPANIRSDPTLAGWRLEDG